MRDRLRQALRGDRTRIWLLGGLGGIGLCLALAAWWFVTSLNAVSPRPLASTAPGEPQAPASAPEPTLAALVTAQPTPREAPEPSPFAGIAQPPAEPAQRSGPLHHTVAADEVLWQIAEQYGLRAETILWSNDIADPDLLLVGQELLIPPTDGVLYTVRPGDSLGEVVTRYGVDLQAVVSTNQLGDADQIAAGVDIFLPGGRPLARPAQAADATDSTGTTAGTGTDQDAAATGAAIALPDNIDALLAAGWLQAQHATDLFKNADRASPRLHQLPGGARLERLDGFRAGRVQVRDPGDGRTRQAMTGWVDAIDLDVGRAPATRELPQAYPADTAMDIAHVFAPYRTQLDGSAYAEANCGPTAVAMALEAFGISVPSRQLRAAALDAQHTYGNGVGTLITALAQVVQQNGLSATDLRDEAGQLRRWGLDDIRAHIQRGQPVIVQVRYRSLPGRGGAYYFGDHYILVTGLVGDGFLYNDPIDIDGRPGWDRTISGATLRVAMNASDQRYAYTAVAVGR
jgi:LysM repeat protein